MVYVKEYEGILQAYEKAGGDARLLKSNEIGRLVVHENNVLSANEVSGIRMKVQQREFGVAINFLIEKGRKIEKPVHLCFGILPEKGRQEIELKVEAQDESEVEVIAHCIFPKGIDILHKMDAEIKIGNKAKFCYRETHYHGEYGGVEVIARGKVMVEEGGRYESTFALVQGLIGKLDYDFEVTTLEKGVSELLVKAYGKEDDEIKVREKIYLNGSEARGLAKTRIVLKDRAKAEVRGETYGNAPFARGHVDCVELVKGREAVAKAIPIVAVNHDQAKVTHEAAIGSIEKKQIQTLMARGLNEEEAVDIIVRGVLK